MSTQTSSARRHAAQCTARRHLGDACAYLCCSDAPRMRLQKFGFCIRVTSLCGRGVSPLLTTPAHSLPAIPRAGSRARSPKVRGAGKLAKFAAAEHRLST